MVSRGQLREFMAPATAVVALTSLCIVSAFYLPFWFDELLTYYVVSDSSFTHMLGAQWDLINTTPPLYFIVTWPVVQTFGAGELPLRLLSSLGISAALLITWHLLRRLYGSWPASVAVLVCFFSSHAVRFQNMEARFYGLFLAEISLAVFLAVLLATRRRSSWGLLAANLVTHAALVTTHYFGILYSGAVFISLVVLLWKQRRQMCAACGSVVLGWLAFAPCLPMFVHHLEFNRPYGWIDPPTVRDLLELFRSEAKSTLPAALIVLALAVATRWLSPASPKRNADDRNSELDAQRRALAIIMGLMLLVPLGVWVISRTVAPVFLARYFIADVLIWSYLFAIAVYSLRRPLHLTVHASGATSLQRLPQFALVLLAAGYVIVPTARTLNQFRTGTIEKHEHLPADLVSALAKYRLPIVMEDTLECLPENYYSAPTQQFLAVIDREAALDPEAIRGANTLDQIGTALKRNYSDLPIVTTRELQAQFDRFLVLDVPWLRWFERNLESRAEYQCEELPEGSLAPPSMKLRVFLVRNLQQPAIGVAPRDWRRR